LRSYQAIPTNRGGVDTASTKRAIALAKSGRFVGMFPEGRINRTDCPLLSIRPGCAVVAMRAGVPLVPIWIEGAPRGWEVYSALFMSAKVRIIVGRPSRFRDSVQDGDTNTNSFVSHESENAPTLSKAQAKEEAVAWMTGVMRQSLTMGGHSKDEINIAGRKWLDD